jgi:hypothetical protein
MTPARHFRNTQSKNRREECPILRSSEGCEVLWKFDQETRFAPSGSASANPRRQPVLGRHPEERSDEGPLFALRIASTVKFWKGCPILRSPEGWEVLWKLDQETRFAPSGSASTNPHRQPVLGHHPGERSDEGPLSDFRTTAIVPRSPSSAPSGSVSVVIPTEGRTLARRGTSLRFHTPPSPNLARKHACL